MKLEDLVAGDYVLCNNEVLSMFLLQVIKIDFLKELTRYEVMFLWDNVKGVHGHRGTTATFYHPDWNIIKVYKELPKEFMI